ncbi:hypothetical protein Ddc_07390 [Ditylenchus destructor]|nr:hypothetical protein Ddc_07390 [Ditylenchus destructor]
MRVRQERDASRSTLGPPTLNDSGSVGTFSNPTRSIPVMPTRLCLFMCVEFFGVGSRKMGADNRAESNGSPAAFYRYFSNSLYAMYKYNPNTYTMYCYVPHGELCVLDVFGEERTEITADRLIKHTSKYRIRIAEGQVDLLFLALLLLVDSMEFLKRSPQNAFIIPSHRWSTADSSSVSNIQYAVARNYYGCYLCLQKNAVGLCPLNFLYYFGSRRELIPAEEEISICYIVVLLEVAGVKIQTTDYSRPKDAGQSANAFLASFGR